MPPQTKRAQQRTPQREILVAPRLARKGLAGELRVLLHEQPLLLRKHAAALLCVLPTLAVDAVRLHQARELPLVVLPKKQGKSLHVVPQREQTDLGARDLSCQGAYEQHH